MRSERERERERERQSKRERGTIGEGEKSGRSDPILHWSGGSTPTSPENAGGCDFFASP
jgi:hypothetical protein